MSKILKEKEQNDLWEWAGTTVDTLHCFPESFNEIMEAQREMYCEKGYTVLDNFVSLSEGSRMCVVKFLVKPIKK